VHNLWISCKPNCPKTTSLTECAYGANQFTSTTQSKGGHIDIEVLVSARPGHIGSMPNANRFVAANGLVESLPCWKMCGICFLEYSIN
jgi:hypothetical protein